MHISVGLSGHKNEKGTGGHREERPLPPPSSSHTQEESIEKRVRVCAHSGSIANQLRSIEQVDKNREPERRCHDCIHLKIKDTIHGES